MSNVRRLRFSSDDDLCLLREVVGQNPLQNPEKWNQIQLNIKSITGKDFRVRTLKDHLMHLLALWKTKSDGDKFRSGTEEVYSEKDVLLQEISDLCTEFHLMPAKKKKVLSKEKQIAEIGRQTRDDNALATVDNIYSSSYSCNEFIDNPIILEEHDYSEPTSVLSASTSIAVAEVDNVDITDQVNTSSSCIANNSVKENKSGPKSKVSGPVRSRHNKSVVLRKNAMEYLNKKNEKEQEIKLKELQLQEQKLKLESKKIQIEEKRLEMEIEDRKNRNEIEYEKIKLDIQQRSELQAQISSQQILINTLLKRLQKYED